MTTIWITGLPESGKTTIAKELMKRLKNVVLLDGNIVRASLSSDLGYTIKDRDKHIKRVADVCALITESGVTNIASVISPTKQIRDYARAINKKFIEVYVKCPVEVCEKRDSKGNYKKFKENIITDFVGKNIPYEEPMNPEIIVDSNKLTPKECAEAIYKKI